MLDIVLHSDTNVPLDISTLKLNVAEFASRITSDDLYDGVRDELKAMCSPEPKPSIEAVAEGTEEATTQNDKTEVTSPSSKDSKPDSNKPEVKS